MTVSTNTAAAPMKTEEPRKLRSVSFTVPGKPMGQPRHRSGVIYRDGKPVTHNGRVMTREYSDGEATSYKAVVQHRAVLAMNEARFVPFAGPVGVEIFAFRECPKSQCKKRSITPERRSTAKPDHDNIAKIICDACNGVVYLDDAQISDARVSKRIAKQGEPPRVVVRFTELPEITEEISES